LNLEAKNVGILNQNLHALASLFLCKVRFFAGKIYYFYIVYA
jgi:hypothetical protein